MGLSHALLAFLGIPAILAAAATYPRLVQEPYFEPNLGQADPSVDFMARGVRYTALIRHNGSAAYRFAGAKEDALDIQFPGAHPRDAAYGEQPVPSLTNFYGGGGQHPISAIPHFQSVRYPALYPGIDLVWRGEGPDLEYEFLVRGRADPSRIRIRFSGARHIFIDGQGNLTVQSPLAQIWHARPVAWQIVDGQRRAVTIALRLAGATASFQLGPYDRRQPLCIDPVVAYSTYVGGGGYDAGYAITTDSAGGVYMTGATASSGFPAAGSGANSNTAAFVMKFDQNGNPIYTTILAGNGNISGQAIAADSSGNVYFAGTTEANNFPASAGAWQTVFGGIADAFAAKLNPSGQLIYASYIGGTGQESGTGIAVDASGSAYVAGWTSSLFPTTPGAAQTFYGGGFADAFVVKLNASGSAAVYATLLGGSETDEAEAIVVNSSGQACIAGYTNSTNLPATAGAVQPSPGGEGDALVACLNTNGTEWTTVSYLGGSNLDQAFALALDQAGNLYVAGTTYSSDFPVTANVFQPQNAGGYDAFVAKLNPAGNTTLYATYLGGADSDAATALAVDSSGCVWIAGYTLSTNFPLSGAWQPVPGGSFEGFVVHLNQDATVPLTSSYLGAAGDDRILGITLDPGGVIFATGSTTSTTFPVTSNAMQSAAPAGVNAFLVEISPSSDTISGQVTCDGNAMSGVTLTLSGSQSGAFTTDGSGVYSFIVPPAGTYTITAGSGFSPASVTFEHLANNQTADFSTACSYSVSLSAVYLDATSQTGPVLDVSAGSTCPWTASSGGFLTVTAGASGTGNGTVSFSATANTTNAARTGTLTVAGQTVAVTQRATDAIFADVPPPAYYFDFAGLMYQAGITSGCSSAPPEYCPNTATTRGEMAVFLIAAIERANAFSYTTTPYFSDVAPASPYFKFVQKLKDLGITNGCTATTYCPDDPVTRGEMAVFIIVSRYGATPYSYPSIPYFTDVPASSPFFPFIQKMAQDGITSGCGPGLFCPNTTLNRGQMAVFIVTGLLNELLPTGTPSLASASPNSANRGQTLTVTLTGVNTHFVQGSTQVAATAGISPSNLHVSSGTRLTVQLTVGAGVAPNPTSIVVTTGAEEAVLPNGFLVQ